MKKSELKSIIKESIREIVAEALKLSRERKKEIEHYFIKKYAIGKIKFPPDGHVWTWGSKNPYDKTWVDRGPVEKIIDLVQKQYD